MPEESQRPHKRLENTADDMDQEIALIRQQPELMALLEQRSTAAKTSTQDEVRKLLGLN